MLQITDFGLVRALSPLATHVSTTSHGTVTHMPPEVLMDGKLRPAADVYSFGVMGEWGCEVGCMIMSKLAVYLARKIMNTVRFAVSAAFVAPHAYVRSNVRSCC